MVHGSAVEQPNGDGKLACRPLYLVKNASGRKYGRWASHFDPYSPIYSRRERSEVMLSDFALGAAASGLCGLGRAYGWLWLLKVTPLLRSLVLTGRQGVLCHALQERRHWSPQHCASHRGCVTSA